MILIKEKLVFLFSILLVSCPADSNYAHVVVFFLPTCFGEIILLLNVRNENTELIESLLCRVSFPQETQQIPTEEVALDICLSNGQKVTVNILTSDQTEDVLDVSGTLHKCTVFHPALHLVCTMQRFAIQFANKKKFARKDPHVQKCSTAVIKKCV